MKLVAATMLVVLFLASGCGGPPVGQIEVRLKEGSCPVDALHNYNLCVRAIMLRRNGTNFVQQYAWIDPDHPLASVADLQSRLSEAMPALEGVTEAADWTLYVAGSDKACNECQQLAEVHICGVADVKIPAPDNRVEVTIDCEPQLSSGEIHEKMKPCFNQVHRLPCGP